MNYLKLIHLKKSISKFKINIYNLDLHKLCCFICLTNIISWFTFLMSPSYLLRVFSSLYPSTLIVIIGVNQGFQMASQVVLLVKNPPANAGDTRDTVQSLGWVDPLEKGMATPPFFPGESHGQKSRAGHGPRGRKALDKTERLKQHNQSSTLSLLTFSLSYTIVCISQWSN